MRCGFTYKVNGVLGDTEEDITRITIKNFENNFCPLEFEHPNNYILAIVEIYGCTFRDLKKDIDFFILNLKKLNHNHQHQKLVFTFLVGMKDVVQRTISIYTFHVNSQQMVRRSQVPFQNFKT